jgi:CRISPR system Cascade subunit CasE
MPADFALGTRLGFSIRVRPVRRTGKSKDNQTKARERDVFAGNEEGENGHAARANAYGAWLEQQLIGAAALEVCAISALRQTKLMTRKRANGEKSTAYVEGPDVIFSGNLQVGSTAAFATLLERGIGRFRSFGFGMMLLRPPI